MTPRKRKASQRYEWRNYGGMCLKHKTEIVLIFSNDRARLYCKKGNHYVKKFKIGVRVA